jgi:hypothetical protein
VTHRILACQEKLYTWKIKDTNICEQCKEEIEGIDHLLVACPNTLVFWNTVFTWWKESFFNFYRNRYI